MAVEKNRPATARRAERGIKKANNQNIARRSGFGKTRFYYDAREFSGAYYWERGFLSCVIAGAKIPPEITVDCLMAPWNRLIFSALREIEKLGIVDVRDRGVHAKLKPLLAFLRETGNLAPDFERYVRGCENMIGIPSAIGGFTLGLLRLRLGGKV